MEYVLSLLTNILLCSICILMIVLIGYGTLIIIKSLLKCLKNDNEPKWDYIEQLNREHVREQENMNRYNELILSSIEDLKNKR